MMRKVVLIFGVWSWVLLGIYYIAPNKRELAQDVCVSYQYGGGGESPSKAKRHLMILRRSV